MKKRNVVRVTALKLVGSPYVWGGTGGTCTVSYRRTLMRQYPDHEGAIRSTCPALRNGQDECDPACKYLGRRVVDCAQLVRLSYKAAGISLPSGASSQWRRGAWLQKGLISEMPRDEVCAVYREKPTSNPMGHTGMYLGDGTVVDARGSRYGTMHKPLTSYPWTHYAIMPGMDDDVPDADVPAQSAPAPPATNATPMGQPTLHRGHRGADVTRLQGLLTAAGYPLEQDGIFGRQTREAVRAYQAAHGLTVDGMVGRQTWGVLMERR